MDMASSQLEWTTLGHRCGIQNCRTKRYRRDPTDGHLCCKYGHQQPDAFETQIEEDEAMRVQSQKTTKRTKAATEQLPGEDGQSRDTGPKFLSGRLAGELFLEVCSASSTEMCHR